MPLSKMRLIDDETKNCSDHGAPPSKAAVAVGNATRRQTGDEVAGLFVTLAPAPAVQSIDAFVRQPLEDGTPGKI